MWDEAETLQLPAFVYTCLQQSAIPLRSNPCLKGDYESVAQVLVGSVFGTLWSASVNRVVLTAVL